MPPLRPRATAVVVDDHDGFRRAARVLLEAGGLLVVGEAADGASAVVEVARLLPRLVLLDVHLPDLDGFEVAARLACLSEPPFVVLTSSRPVSSFRRRLARSPGAMFVEQSNLSGESLAARVA